MSGPGSPRAASPRRDKAVRYVREVEKPLGRKAAAQLGEAENQTRKEDTSKRERERERERERR